MNLARSCWLLLLVVFAVSASGAESVLARSKSGQFVVRGIPVEAPPPGAPQASPVDYVRLDPSALTVSLERIKSALLTQLQQRDGWRGTVYVNVQPRPADDQPVIVTSLRHSDGWSYRLTVPEIVPPGRYVRAVVQVLLMEMANRRAGERPAELPPWLAPGLSAQLLASAPTSLVPEPHTRTVRLQRPADSLRPAIEVIRSAGPLTLDQLNLPDDDYLDGPQGGLYQSCAQVLVVSLLRLKNGGGQLNQMLEQLPECLNWQTGFLRAFSEHFPRLVDADKWWSLQVIRTTGREPDSQWRVGETIQQLDEILESPVELRDGPDALPTAGSTGLRVVLQTWDLADQHKALSQKIDQLSALLARAPATTAGLIAEYRRTLVDYLEDRAPQPVASQHRHPSASSARMVVNEALRRLNRLDAQRGTMLGALEQLPPGSAAQAGKSPAPASSNARP